MNGPIFILGPHRAGSTLWHNLIAMSRGVLRLPEPRFLGAPRQKDFKFFLQTQVGDLSNDKKLEKMVESCFSRKRIPGLEGAFWRFEGIQAVENPELRRDIFRKIRTSDRSVGAIAKIIIEELVCFSGCSRACVKFPVDVRHVGELIRWFPDCKIVHITRDPRALAMSKSNDPSGTALKLRKHPRLAWVIRKAALFLVIAQYRLSARLHLQFKALSNYRLFRFEDLLAAPENVLRELCSFVGIEFSEDMLEPQKGIHEHQPSSLTGKRQKAFDVEAALRWRTVISPVDNLVVLALTNKSMAQLDYDPKLHPIFGRIKEL